MKSKYPKIVVIVGPTASGKSDLAIQLALQLNSGQAKLTQAKQSKKLGINGAEIISADSRQVYRGMDIGTGKVKRDSIKGKKRETEYYSSGIRHHLIDIASPKRQFTVAQFKKLGEKAIKDILSRGKVPIIVGGTGFYIDVLLDRMPIAEVPPNLKLRRHFNKLNAEHLFKMLRKLDPQRAETIEPKNKRRLIRALEIIYATGKSVTKYKIRDTRYEILWIGLNPDDLEKIIKTRLDKRLKQGMIKEVEELHKDGVSWKRLDDFGLEYRWVSRWLIQMQKLKIKDQNDPEQIASQFNGAGNSKFKNFKNSEYYEILLRDIIKYSKRQMTWFKRNKEIRWLAPRAWTKLNRMSKVEGIKSQKEAEGLLARFLRL